VPRFWRFLKLLVGYFQKGIVIIAGGSCWRCYRRYICIEFQTKLYLLSIAWIWLILTADFEQIG
jgi:hypothetical protein